MREIHNLVDMFSVMGFLNMARAMRSMNTNSSMKAADAVSVQENNGHLVIVDPLNDARNLENIWHNNHNRGGIVVKAESDSTLSVWSQYKV